MTVAITIDRMALLKQAMKALNDSSVLIGIPSNNDRNFRTDTPETNAEIGFINEFGEPSKNIPPRPFLLPGANLAMPKNTKIMLKAVKDVMTLHGNPIVVIDIALNDVGINSQNSVQYYIAHHNFQRLADYTLKLRKERGFMGERPLNETGSLKASITYMVV